MPQSTDIVLHGAGYMLEPGTYKRLQDGMAEGRTERTSLTDFFGGQPRSLQLERDKFAASLNIGPAFDGQGVQPWALSVPRANIPIPTGDAMPVGGTRMPYAVVNNRVYFAIGKTLYWRNFYAGASGTVPVRSYPNIITDLCIYAATGLLIAFGGAADIIWYNAVTNTDTTLITGERGHYIETYGGYAVWTEARAGYRPTVLRMATGGSIQQRLFEYPAIGLTTVAGQLLLITEQALYTFTGRVRDVMVNNPAWTPASPDTVPKQIPGQEWSGELQPFVQHGVHTEADDYRFVLGYGGRTLAWIAGSVMEYKPTGDRAGWKTTGLSGLQCYGACVAGGYVVVALLSHAYMMELWAYDGNGWWRFGLAPYEASGNWCNPIPIGGGSGDHDITVFHHNTPAVTTFRLAPRSGGITAYAPDAWFMSPLIDGGYRDKQKAWRKVGAVFAAPSTNGLYSTDTVAVYLDVSLDNGLSWTIADSKSLTGNVLTNLNFELTGTLLGPTSTFIQLRVRWQSVDTWTPILVGVWAEYEVLSSPARRRKWTFKVKARDQEIDRNGVMLSRTGRQLIDELWAAWETDTVVTFRDIDHDTDPVDRTVRIVGITEVVEQPADSGEWGDSLITMNLVEV